MIGIERSVYPFPLPPNRTGGSPASGFPVGGFTSKRNDERSACRSRVHGRKPSTGTRGFDFSEELVVDRIFSTKNRQFTELVRSLTSLILHNAKFLSDRLFASTFA
jgi:hypothetical protein